MCSGRWLIWTKETEDNSKRHITWKLLRRNKSAWYVCQCLGSWGNPLDELQAAAVFSLTQNVKCRPLLFIQTHYSDSPLHQRQKDPSLVCFYNVIMILKGNIWSNCGCVSSSVVSIILLILSSCYLAFRVCSLEQQLSFLNNPNLPLRER